MQRKLTACGGSPPSVITYSIEPPSSNCLSVVNNTPPELMFFVTPECFTRSGPLRVIANGNSSE